MAVTRSQKSDTPAVEERADTTAKRELTRYRYIGGMDGVTVQVAQDGTSVKFERDSEQDVPAGLLDDHPDFEKVESKKSVK